MDDAQESGPHLPSALNPSPRSMMPTAGWTKRVLVDVVECSQAGESDFVLLVYVESELRLQALDRCGVLGIHPKEHVVDASRTGSLGNRYGSRSI